MRRRREWGTMVADVDHLGHDASTDIVGLLWVVSYAYVGMQNAYDIVSDNWYKLWNRSTSLKLEKTIIINVY
jgi:hypothetical protein